MRIAVDCTAVIDFELNAEMAKAFAMEHEVRCVAVFVNNLAVRVPAGRAVSVVVAVPVRAVTMNNAAAVIAANIIFVKAMLAERVRIILDSIFLINPFVAVVADDSQPVCAILAEPVTFYLKHIFNRMFCTEVCTNSGFLHWLFLHFI